MNEGNTEVVIDNDRFRTSRQRSPVVADSLGGILHPPCVAQGQVGPEVIRIFLLNPGQISGRIFAQCLQPLTDRQQEFDGLNCQPCSLDKFDKPRPTPPCGRIADLVAPGLLVSTPRDFQQPILPILF